MARLGPNYVPSLAVYPAWLQSFIHNRLATITASVVSLQLIHPCPFLVLLHAPPLPPPSLPMPLALPLDLPPLLLVTIPLNAAMNVFRILATCSPSSSSRSTSPDLQTHHLHDSLASYSSSLEFHCTSGSRSFEGVIRLPRVCTSYCHVIAELVGQDRI